MDKELAKALKSFTRSTKEMIDYLMSDANLSENKPFEPYLSFEASFEHLTEGLEEEENPNWP